MKSHNLAKIFVFVWMITVVILLGIEQFSCPPCVVYTNYLDDDQEYETPQAVD